MSLQANIHIDVHRLLESITCRGFHSDCIPSSFPTDKLATLKAKQLKAAGGLAIKPAPYMDACEWAPNWGKVRLCVLVYCMGVPVLFAHRQADDADPEVSHSLRSTHNPDAFARS